MNVLNYIQHWAKVNGIEQYRLEHKTLRYAEFSAEQIKFDGIAFVYDFELVGNMASIADYNKNLIVIASERMAHNYKEDIKLAELFGAVKAYSNSIHVHETYFRIDTTAQAVFSTIYGGHIKYFQLIKL